MKLIFPINIKKLSLDLPFIFQFDNKKITIENFSIKEKEKIFQIDNLKIIDKTISCKKIMPYSYDYILNYQEFVLSNYKIVIEGKTDNPNELQILQEKLEFAFKIIMGCDFPITKFENKNIKLYNGISCSNHSIISKKNNELNLDNIERIKKITEILICKVNDKKIKILKDLFNIAIYATNISISCAFYITILESIFVSDTKLELSYTLGMRITKKRGKDYEYKEDIKKLYNKRSNVFHGNNSDYSQKDIKFLEQEATWAIEEFLKEPKLFEPKKLDKLLLN